MHLYVYMEDEESALKLCKKFTEDEEYENDLPVEFAIPLAALYFKKADFNKAKKYLIEAQEINENTIDFFERLSDGDIDFDINMESFMYNTIEELEVMFVSNMYFYVILQHFIMWTYEILDSRYNK